MDPQLRVYVFHQPFAFMLPYPVRRILLGRAAGSAEEAVKIDEAATSAAEIVRKAPRRNSGRFNEDGELAGEDVSISESRREGRTDNLIELVRGMEGVAKTTKASRDISSMERIITQKVLFNTQAFAARTLATSAKANVMGTVSYTKNKVAEIGGEVREAVSDQETRAAAVSGAA